MKKSGKSVKKVKKTVESATFLTFAAYSEKMGSNLTFDPESEKKPRYLGILGGFCTKYLTELGLNSTKKHQNRIVKEKRTGCAPPIRPVWSQVQYHLQGTSLIPSSVVCFVSATSA